MTPNREAEVGGEKRAMHEGETCLVAASTPHRFSNTGTGKAVTFNVYSPPAYPADEEE